MSAGQKKYLGILSLSCGQGAKEIVWSELDKRLKNLAEDLKVDIVLSNPEEDFLGGDSGGSSKSTSPTEAKLGTATQTGGDELADSSLEMDCDEIFDID
jgi:hypothetical protein